MTVGLALPFSRDDNRICRGLRLRVLGVKRMEFKGSGFMGSGREYRGVCRDM